MTKVLKVVDPFLRLDLGDVFEQNEDGDYVATVREDFTNNADNGAVYTTKYHADFTISKDYAEQMVKDGYLEEVATNEQNKSFVNIFDEIDTLINKYKNDMIEAKTADLHPAVKRESEVVYTNLLTILEHLKSLKKQ